MKTIITSLGCLIAFGCSLFAQSDDSAGPGWLRLSPLPRGTHATPTYSGGNPEPAVTPMGAPLVAMNFGGEPVIAEFITPEITALAQGLQNDPKAIFDYVHNHIRYVHYFGSKKGAHVTMLERSGNDFDQCALLVALLRAADQNDPGKSYTVSYEFGAMKIPYQAEGPDLRKWVGLTLPQTTVPDNWTDIVTLLDNVNYFRGYPKMGAGYLLVPNGDPVNFIWLRPWVKLVDGANTYYLDPSFKTSTQVAGVDVAAAMQLNAGNLLANAASGATITSDYVQSLNLTQLKTTLGTYTANLLQYLNSAAHKNHAVDEVISGFRIEEAETLALPTSLLFPSYDGTISTSEGAKNIPKQAWDNIPSAYMSTIRLVADNVDVTYPFPELRGRKLAITFVSSQVRITLDDVVNQSGSGGSGTTVNLRTYVNHPFGNWNYTTPQSITDVPARYDQNDGGLIYQRAAAPGGYVMNYGFDDPNERVVKSQEKLEAYRRQGLSDTSAEVITETLHVMGLSWVQQTTLAQAALGAQKDVQVFYHHRIGRSGSETGTLLGYYVDLPMNYDASVWRGGGFDSPVNPVLKIFEIGGGYFGSAFEHGILEQWQDNPSASTIKCLHVANSNGKKIIRATSANWSSIQTYLDAEPLAERYTTDQRNTISSRLSGGSVILLPSSAKNPVGAHWKGYGYVDRRQSGGGISFGMMISGGYAGGFAGTQTYVSPALPSTLFTTSPTYYSFTPPSLTPVLSWDPVDMADGAFVLENTDLTTGQPEPRGFSFTRHYSSNRRYQSTANMARGWTHNYIVNAAERSDPLAALGKNTPQEMAATIVGIRAAYEVLSRTPDGTYPESALWAVSSLITEWTVDQLVNNAVNITMGPRSVQFIKQPTGATSVTYVPPANVTMTLTKPANYVLQQRHGNMFNFDGNKRLSTIVDPYGKTMTFTYHGDGRPDLITDAFNRKLDFEYDSNERLKWIDDNDGSADQRRVTFTYATTYSPQYDLVSVTDVEGKISRYEYDNEHKILVTKDAMATPRTIVQNIYDTFGRVKEQRSEGDPTKTWKLAFARFSSVEVDPQGGVKTFYYDEKNRSLGSKDALGNRSRLTYDGQDHVIREITPKGEITEHEYDEAHNLTRTTQAVGVAGKERTTYRFYEDLARRLTKVRDFRGQDTVYVYNDKHQVTSITSPNVNDTLPNVVEFGYYPSDVANGRAGNLEWQEDQDDYRVYFRYDTKGQMTRRTLPDDGDPTTLDYEEFVPNYRGDVMSHTDLGGNTTSYLYNKRRQMTQKTEPAPVVGGSAPVTLLEYDNVGNLWKTTDPKGYVTERTYNASGKLLLTKLPTLPGPVTPEIENHYDTRNWLDWTENPLNERTSFAYDAVGRVTHTTDPLFRTVINGYDANGQHTTVTSPLDVTPPQTTTTAFDALGRVDSVTDSMNPGNLIDYEYDANGNRTKVINRRNVQFVSTYYNNNQLATFKTPLLKTTSTTYKKRGMPDTIVEPSTQQTVYGYDSRGRLTSLTDGVTGGTPAAYTYDANGNPLTHVEGTKTITRGYDNLNRLTSYSYADTANPTHNYTLGYQYDDNGNLSVLTYPGNMDTTALGPFEAETATRGGGVTVASSFAGYTGTGYAVYPTGTGRYVLWSVNMVSGGFYDLKFRYRLSSGTRNLEIQVNGQVVDASLTFPTASSWTYITVPQQALQPGANTIQVKAINSGSTSLLMDHLSVAPIAERKVFYAYDSHNRLSTVTDWYNRVTAYTYDLAGRVKVVERPGGSRREIEYNDAGDTTMIKELASNGNYVNYFKFDYDTGGRVKNEFIAPVPAAYSETPQTITYNADNQISQLNGVSVVHDADGNMTSGPLTGTASVAHTYDTRNRLVSVGGVTYTYDSEGNRITLTQNGQTTRYVVNPNAALSQTLVRIRPDGSKTYYVYGNGLLYDVEATSAEVETGVRRNYHYDYRGSTVALTDTTGTVVERIEYSVYGVITRRAGTTVDTPFLFNGEYGVMTDSNGLYHMRARYYNPHIKRFINADPAGFSGGLNFYAYADGNPISYLDPFGLWSWNQTVGALRVVGGALETAGGLILGGATSWSGVGAVAGGAVALHGLDQIHAGFGQIFSGQPTDSTTSRAIQSLGVSQSTANAIDSGISIGGSFGAGLATTSIRVSQLTTTSISAEVANASLARNLLNYEVGQKTLSGSGNAFYSTLWPNTLDRGAAIIADQGLRTALTSSSSGWWLGLGTTFGTGPTPLGLAASTAIFNTAAWGGNSYLNSGVGGSLGGIGSGPSPGLNFGWGGGK